ncbi:helix-turn-helix domain-containing protein [Paenibacillus albiflavus]|uniref:Helix-turn-helix domain-containing protein n=1 Tax=Paenibacillus albiflavus TaxID=2545760 RepID=A0A4R4E3F1_9BACL|nr:helix-turn-helix domain-containing protein [Paenibacillus albiflavus]TCZ73180.1 helix-turn-helix domain-containing protein [Paenibacillus albiflavus]
MFSMEKIGKNIASLRKKKDITQMGLADQLGISYQAISNWERGETMPDISKLPVLAEIFGVSIDEILDDGKEAKLIKKVIEQDTADYFQNNEVTVEEITTVAPLLSASQADDMFNQIKDSFNIKELIPLAPFISSEVLDELARKATEVEGIKNITPLAPFLSREVLDELVLKIADTEGIRSITAIAPFVSKAVLSELAKKELEAGGMRSIVSIAPFLDEDFINAIVRKVAFTDKKDA